MPKKEKRNRVHIYSLRLTPDEWELLNWQAQREGRKRSKLVREALAQALAPVRTERQRVEAQT